MLTTGCDDTTTPLPEGGEARATAIVRAVTCKQNAEGAAPRIYFVWDSPVSDALGCATIDQEHLIWVDDAYVSMCTVLQESRDFKMPITFRYTGTNQNGCLAATAVEMPTKELRRQYR